MSSQQQSESRAWRGDESHSALDLSNLSSYHSFQFVGSLNSVMLISAFAEVCAPFFFFCDDFSLPWHAVYFALLFIFYASCYRHSTQTKSIFISTCSKEMFAEYLHLHFQFLVCALLFFFCFRATIPYTDADENANYKLEST